MIVKLVNDEHNEVKFVDCKTVHIQPDAHMEGMEDTFTIIFDSPFNRHEWPLVKNTFVYFMNDDGETIDRDFRVCGAKLDSLKKN